MHKKKHDMMLSLNKTNPCASDETPTPTRFIRNCEAIGLFQDLQNVNPFEETFRQATEAVKKGELLRVPSISSLENPAGEDLHTPHIDIRDEANSGDNYIISETDLAIQSVNDISVKSGSLQVSSNASTLIKENRTLTKSNMNDVKFFVTIPNGTIVQFNSGSNGTRALPAKIVKKLDKNQTHHRPNQNISDNVKKKLKETLMKIPKEKTTTDVVQIPRQKASVDHQFIIERPVPSSSAEENEEDRKRRSLERNRIAAMRCREKRKKWVADLREKYEKICHTNEVLVEEVMFLRKEVVRLQKLLKVSQGQSNVNELLSHGEIVSLNSLSSSQPKRSNMEDTVEDSNVVRFRRDGLTLDIEGASRIMAMDLDSPLVMKDEILSSVALPTTPNERLISFTEEDNSDSEVEDVTEERVTTTVIQVNPHALHKNSLGYS